jgi:hypothetical protein
MEAWRAANRFPGDSLLVRDTEGGPQEYICMADGWYGRRAGKALAKVSAGSVVEKTGLPLLTFVWRVTVRVLTERLQESTQKVAATVGGHVNGIIDLDVEVIRSLADDLQELQRLEGS